MLQHNLEQHRRRTPSFALQALFRKAASKDRFSDTGSDTDIDPRMMIQLVLSKDGRLGGTYYHINTENTREVRGSLDKETQRIAFKIGDKSDDVIEVGLEGLSQGEAPIWVHFENGTKTQTWTLIRLDPPAAAVAERKSAEAAGSK